MCSTETKKKKKKHKKNQTPPYRQNAVESAQKHIKPISSCPKICQSFCRNVSSAMACVFLRN
jgi:hypothetical protein